MMGFGIRTAADVLPLADLIDGAIVGSYFIRLLEEQGFAPEAAETYCRTFKKGTERIEGEKGMKEYIAKVAEGESD